MNIIVCIKQVPDPEAPASGYKVDSEAKRVIPPKGTPPVINPDDESALEAALRIKEVHESSITVISMGHNLSRAVLGKSLAVGADNLVFLDNDVFGDLDSYATAFILSTAIKRLEGDLILTGRLAADSNAGQVGLGIAEFLGIPSVTSAQKVESYDGRVRVERTTPSGYEIIEAPIPALITITTSLGDLRTASLQGIMAARKKPITTWKLSDLGIELSQLSQLRRTKLLELYPPPRRGVSCEIIQGATPEEMGANLALKIREAKII